MDKIRYQKINGISVRGKEILSTLIKGIRVMAKSKQKLVSLYLEKTWLKSQTSKHKYKKKPNFTSIKVKINSLTVIKSA